MTGLVIKSTGSWYTVRKVDGGIVDCRIKGNFRIKDIKSTNPIAVGDEVDFELEKDNDSTVEAKGVINKIAPRKNYIIRKSINLSRQTHILAANIDRAFLIVTVASPRTSVGFMDRFLVTAEAYHIPVTIVFNKMDICDTSELEEVEKRSALYSKLGYSCCKVSAFKESDLFDLRGQLKDKINLLSGHSGVGKSTLINGLDSSLSIKTAQISDAHSKGTHTTTFAEMHELKSGGFIIDTPGIKEIGIVDIEKEELWSFFPEFRERVNQCKFNNCLHIHEPGCKVKQDVESGEIALSRYNSYCSIFNGEEN
ncbi:MAG: ribosome small subunit-dependent GTPase A [Bacteroidetes bacterium]|nr:ribosome small subunit-dependent GTPase A [Bacteroidota bacterium]